MGSVKDFFRVVELDHRFADNYFKANISQSARAGNDEFQQKPKEPGASSYKAHAWNLFEKADGVAATSGGKGAVGTEQEPGNDQVQVAYRE